MIETLSKIQQPQSQSLSSSTNSYIGQSEKEKRLSTEASDGIEVEELFSIECDQLLESICDFWQKIQGEAVKNVKQASQIMKKFKILKQIKDYIDQQWKLIQQNMKKFLKTDEQLIKEYTQLRLQAMSVEQQIQTCQNIDQLRNLSKLLQNSPYIMIQDSKLKMCSSQQIKLQQKIGEWENLQKQIDDSEQIIRQYSMKIVEVVMDDDEEYQQQNSNKKTNTKEYFAMRQEVQCMLNASKQLENQRESENQSQEEVEVKDFEKIQLINEEKSEEKQKQIEKASNLIQKIFELYGDIQL